MKTVKKTTRPEPKAVSSPALDKVRQSLSGTQHAHLLDREWTQIKRGGWNIGRDYSVDVQGSTVIVCRVWNLPIKF